MSRAAYFREYRSKRRHGEGLLGPAPTAPAPPPPPSFARCRRGCGRLVWHFDRGLCGACGHRGQGRRAA